MRFSISALYVLIAVPALLTGCGGVSSTPTALLQQNDLHSSKHASGPCPCLYVANNQGQSVTVYASGATGNAKPIQTIAGNNTALGSPEDVAVDAGGTIYVANAGGNSVTVYAAGASGNVAPIRAITGSNTGLDTPFGIALDPLNGDIYVTNNANSTVTV